MKKIIPYILMILLLTGCATTQSNNYGSYSKSFGTELIFYSQYEIRHIVKTNKGPIEVVRLFLSDYGETLPPDTVSVSLGLYIINPNKLTLTAVKKCEFLNVNTNKIYFKRQMSFSIRELPEKILNIELPTRAEFETKITFSVEVLDAHGDQLYRSTIASYKVRGKN